jgi:hypothetical protein
MTDRELMQQALEALEWNLPVIEDYGDHEQLNRQHRAIIALRERLAQPEQPAVPWSAALESVWGEPEPEPEQEPVATVVARQYDDGTHAGNALDWAGRNCEDDFPVGTKLFTIPPHRKPLTPQSPCEMTQAEGRMFKLGWLECEAAHGIKGEA